MTLEEKLPRTCVLPNKLSQFSHDSGKNLHADTLSDAGQFYKVHAAWKVLMNFVWYLQNLTAAAAIFFYKIL